MKFEKITDNKIKVVFTLEDMSLNNISAKSFLSNNSISPQIFQDMLKEAEKQLGFQADDSKLLVEAIMSADGGLIFTITKLSDYIKTNNFSNIIFQFENLDNFLSFCTYIENIDNFNNLSVILYNNMYYLCFSSFNDKIHNYFYNILTEFANPIPYSSSFDGLLHEYGKVILNNDTIQKFIKYYI